MTARVSFVASQRTNLMTSIYETYAAKICRHVELPPGTYDSQKLNSYIMALPLGKPMRRWTRLSWNTCPGWGYPQPQRPHAGAFFQPVAEPCP